MAILDRIHSSAHVKALPEDLLPQLCRELRSRLLETVSKTGGHLASNLGVVELTVAIHRVFDTSKDRLVFDVGHQSYIHKMLTGRLDRFDTLRQYGGLSGFPKPCESADDAFIAGHASNSISVALGMARARTLEGRDNYVIALLGDGALTGGLAYEALSDVGDSGEPLIIILNDNGMSITPNVGGMAHYLAKQRLKPSYATFKRRYRKLMSLLPGGKAIYRFFHGIKSAVKEAILHCSMFEEMGLQYAGPIDGHDLKLLVETLSWAKGVQGPVVIHVITKKGKGYPFSEETPDIYHGVSPFDLEKGVLPGIAPNFSTVFGETMCALAEESKELCAITAAMTSGTGLEEFAFRYPRRFFDVGIAEEHAAAMAAGLASQGMIPVFAVYSTFLQRSYDMLLHDVALSQLHVVFGVDRAGLVGADGETHQGIFDVGYLTTVPGMRIYSPASYGELRDMLRKAVFEEKGPVAVRYPRGVEGAYTASGAENSRILREGSDVTIVTYGVSVNDALAAAERLSAAGVSAEVVKLGRIWPLDLEQVRASSKKTGRLCVLEECVNSGCIGEHIAAELAAARELPDTLILRNLGNRFIPQGDIATLRRAGGIDGESVAAAILEAIGDEQGQA